MSDQGRRFAKAEQIDHRPHACQGRNKNVHALAKALLRRNGTMVVQELKLQVADILKTVVKGAAWAIEQGTEVAYGFAPDNMERSTVRLRRLSGRAAQVP